MGEVVVCGAGAAGLGAAASLRRAGLGSRAAPDVVIAATGYRRGLEPLVGHLGCQDKGTPLLSGGRQDPAAPGLFFHRLPHRVLRPDALRRPLDRSRSDRLNPPRVSKSEAVRGDSG